MNTKKLYKALDIHSPEEITEFLENIQEFSSISVTCEAYLRALLDTTIMYYGFSLRDISIYSNVPEDLLQKYETNAHLNNEELLILLTGLGRLTNFLNTTSLQNTANKYFLQSRFNSDEDSDI